jgi:uncharacterized protein GlcG (DUF336 family)
MSQSILSIDPAGARRALLASQRKSIELRVSFDIAGVDTDDHLLPAARTDSRWLGSIAIAIDGRVVGALDISGRGTEPDTIVAHAPPRGFGEGGG